MDKPTLEGEMLRLRPVRVGDADAMWDMLSDPEARRLTGVTRKPRRAEVDAWCAAVAGSQDRVDLAVTVHGRDEYLGEIVLFGIDPVVRRADLRLSMRPAFRGRGYGTEAIELVLGMAFGGLGLHRVGLDVLSINTRAQSMYENIGFRVEGRLRDAHRDGDGYCDAVLMGLLEEEWDGRGPG